MTPGVNSVLNEEEKLAEEVLGRIRGFVQRHKTGDRRNLPRLRIKFCGGCNSVLDRSWIARAIRFRSGNDMDWVGSEEDADLVIILSGCSTACADRPEGRTKARYYLTICPGAVSAVCATAEESG